MKEFLDNNKEWEHAWDESHDAEVTIWFCEFVKKEENWWKKNVQKGVKGN